MATQTRSLTQIASWKSNDHRPTIFAEAPLGIIENARIAGWRKWFTHYARCCTSVTLSEQKYLNQPHYRRLHGPPRPQHVWYHGTRGILAAHGQRRIYKRDRSPRMCLQTGKREATAPSHSVSSQQLTGVYPHGCTMIVAENNKRQTVSSGHDRSIFQAHSAVPPGNQAQRKLRSSCTATGSYYTGHLPTFQQIISRRNWLGPLK